MPHVSPTILRLPIPRLLSLSREPCSSLGSKQSCSRPDGLEEIGKPLARFDELLFRSIRRALGVVRWQGDGPLEVQGARVVVLDLLVFTNHHATMRLCGELERFDGPLHGPGGHIPLSRRVL